MVLSTGLLVASLLTALIGCDVALCHAPAATPDDRSKHLYCNADTAKIELLPPIPAPIGWREEFCTDFSRSIVSFGEILDASSRHAIEVIDTPRFVDPQQAMEWYRPNEPVIYVRLGDDARAYPIQILLWHELVNDVIDGRPVVVTFCPLCNTAIALERTIGRRVMAFGLTGRLRNSNMLMYDRETESWWQQASGQAIIGELAGKTLKPVPTSIISFGEFVASYPEGRVLSRETGSDRPYGVNPYPGYDNMTSSPFLRKSQLDKRLLPMQRVLGMATKAEAVAYPYDVLRTAHVVNDRIDTHPVVVFWSPEAVSPFDAKVVDWGRQVGGALAYCRNVDGRTLTFDTVTGGFVDRETGSRWNIFGEAVEGVLKGRRLRALNAVNHFWFSWAVTKPKTKIYQLESTPKTSPKGRVGGSRG